MMKFLGLAGLVDSVFWRKLTPQFKTDQRREIKTPAKYFKILPRGRYPNYLKVLSSEMDPAEIRLIPKNFIKGNVEAGL